MPFGAFTQGQSYRSGWVRPTTRTAPAGRGAASLVLGSELTDEVVQATHLDGVVVGTAGDTEDSRLLQLRGEFRLNDVPENFQWQFSFQFIGGAAHTLGFPFSHTAYGHKNVATSVPLDDFAINIEIFDSCKHDRGVFLLIQNGTKRGSDVCRR